MNARTAKLLRKSARHMTVGQKDVQYRDVALNPEKPTRRTRQLYECTRQVYRELKKRLKAA